MSREANQSRMAMGRTFLVALSTMTLMACGSSAAPAPASVPCPPSVIPPAGKFEMKNYFMGFLRRGPNWTAEQTPEVKQIGEGHMAHIRAMGATGKLILAGPFEVEGTPPNALAGILLFDVETIEEARVMASNDPAVKAGRFTLEVIPWYGPKGITFPGREIPPLK
ncbi:MAG TPA: YciI family protein [Polyangium sp.]|nr:YciI family protein [Polyangium sp.]